MDIRQDTLVKVQTAKCPCYFLTEIRFNHLAVRSHSTTVANESRTLFIGDSVVISSCTIAECARSLTLSDFSRERRQESPSFQESPNFQESPSFHKTSSYGPGCPLSLET